MSKPAFSERHPYRFVALLELMVVAVYLLAGTLDHFVHLGNLGLYVVANIALTVLVALLISLKGWWRLTGFAQPLDRRALPYLLVPLAPAVVNLYPGLRVTGIGQVAGFLALALMVGFVEEGIFRGLMLRTLEPRGVWRAVIVSTVLFSLTHLMNILAGESGLQAALQLLYTFAIGFAFCALVLRGGLIAPLVVVHALLDFVVFLRDPSLAIPPAFEYTFDIAVTVVFVAYGLFVLLRSPKAESLAEAQDGAAAQRAAV